MSETVQASATTTANPAELHTNLTRTLFLWNSFVSKWASQSIGKMPQQVRDEMGIAGAFANWSKALSANPMALGAATRELWQEQFRLWQRICAQMMGFPDAPLSELEAADKRFKHPAWDRYPAAKLVVQNYLNYSRWWHSLLEVTEGMTKQDARKVDFFVRQMVDALAPNNFAQTNPQVWEQIQATNGENLVTGMENLISDLHDGQLHIRMTDTEAFELGRNIANTPGKVVYRNELMELIQYSPSTDRVRKRPLLIVPPWINKYYILDLQEKNSFIKWAVDQGHTVFVIAWVNPTEELREKNFEDYMLDGPLAAMDAIEQATGERDINMIGYCIGGTLSAATLAYMAEKGDDRVRSATFFTTLLDFAQPGEIEVFLDEMQIGALEKRMDERGFLDGREMGSTFNLLRSNDLIWSFFVGLYLLGKDPMPFDLLYWNADSTRMPSNMHSFYLRNMYLENRLREPGGITLAGVPVDLRKVNVPVYFISAHDDHIAPWRSTYAGTQMFSGPVRFVLSASGHIAGIINPPARDKYGHWVNDSLPDSAENWQAGAVETPGSWWRDWDAWVMEFADGEVEARQPGSGKLDTLMDAPGSYVLDRS